MTASGPVLRVIRGDATPDEIAAVVAVLLSRPGGAGRAGGGASEAAARDSKAATTAAISSGVASPRMTRRTGPEALTTVRSA